MIFVTADSDRTQLEELTRLLVAAFPGSTIYQHVNPLRAPRDVLHNRISGVFLEAEMEGIGGIELMQMLRRQQPDVPVFILSRSEAFREKAMEAGAAGYLLRPLTEEGLRDALLSGKKEHTHDY